jgi:uncharacterized protein YbaR (Trm112 family)
MDTRLLELLVCPLCKGPLEFVHASEDQPVPELVCHGDRLAFPVRDGIPVMLEHDARVIEPITVSQPMPL